jgi:hypothetical protein
MNCKARTIAACKGRSLKYGRLSQVQVLLEASASLQDVQPGLGKLIGIIGSFAFAPLASAYLTIAG